MMGIRFIPLVFKQVSRHSTRTLLTMGGVAVAVFLFVAVQTLQRGVSDATHTTAKDTKLVVYRENRFCPATSRLPEYYGDRIAKVPGVVSVTPMKIVVNNCRASLDVITFRGVEEEDIGELARSWEFVEGSTDEWMKRTDSALVGERLANRRGFKVGQSIDSSGVTVSVAGIIRSSEAQDQNVAYVHLPFLQRSAGGGGLGIVTQYSVKVEDPAKLAEVAKAIDEEFRSEQEPTTTRPEKAFVAQAGADVVHIVGFTQWLGWGCLAAVLALVANSIVLSVQDRVREHAVLQTLGYRSSLIASLIVSEGAVVALLGGVVGTVAAALTVQFGKFSLSSEGLSINIAPDWGAAALGLGISALTGVVAGLVPAWQASRREIAACFRAV